jgi:hypothetical protein
VEVLVSSKNPQDVHRTEDKEPRGKLRKRNRRHRSNPQELARYRFDNLPGRVVHNPEVHNCLLR